VVRQHDMYGDFLLATPVFRALRLRFPDAKIGAVVRETFGELLRHNPDIDRIVTVPRDRSKWSWSAFRSLWGGLRDGWDLVIVLTTVSHSLTSDLLGILASPRVVVGSASPLLRGARRNFLFNVVVPLAPDPRHQSERNLDIVRVLGADTSDLTEYVAVSPDERATAAERFRMAGATDSAPIVGVHIGAGKVGNRWPAERFADLAKRLAAQGMQIALMWGPAEVELRDRFVGHFPHPVILLPPSSLRDLAANMHHCSFVLCNDTGVMHLCAAVGTPLVAMFGPTPAADWKPVGEKFVAVQSLTADINDITVAQAWEATATLMK
jgi:ADP-heptose:LPS heptosyltransferase